DSALAAPMAIGAEPVERSWTTCAANTAPRTPEPHVPCSRSRDFSRAPANQRPRVRVGAGSATGGGLLRRGLLGRLLGRGLLGGGPLGRRPRGGRLLRRRRATTGLLRGGLLGGGLLGRRLFGGRRGRPDAALELRRQA